MVQIQAKWPKSGQNLGVGGQNIGQNNEPWVRIGVFWPDLGHFAWIWAIMLGFGPFCLDLGHIAWIWAIWQNMGQNRPQRRRSPEDGAGGTNGQTNGRTYIRMDRFPLCSTGLRPLRGCCPKRQKIHDELNYSSRSNQWSNWHVNLLKHIDLAELQRS